MRFVAVAVAFVVIALGEAASALAHVAGL